MTKPKKKKKSAGIKTPTPGPFSISSVGVGGYSLTNVKGFMGFGDDKDKKKFDPDKIAKYKRQLLLKKWAEKKKKEKGDD